MPMTPAERGAAREANLAKLPRTAYSTNEAGALILIDRGEDGYHLVDRFVTSAEFPTYDALADHLNEAMGVTPRQRFAMEMGSMWGFHAPAADPDRYTPEEIAARKARKAA